jgi:putative ABC transport system ATP-binding protein
VIEVEDLTKTFALGGEEVHALAGITETIAAGEHVAVMGPSGSGKTTLLNVLGCLDVPTSGRYRLFGRDVAALDEAALSEVRLRTFGFVFQSYHLVPRLDAAANVELPLVLAGVPRRERAPLIRAALEKVGIADRARHRPAELSGGQAQRVAIARAIVLDPKVVLADEPTGNLDRASGALVLDLLDALNDQGRTLIVVTHDPLVARRADRIVVLIDGRIAHRLRGDETERLTQILMKEESPP